MKKIFFLLILLLITFKILSIDISSKYLFITTTPIKAKVLIEGADKGVLTPCIIRNISPNQQSITIQKDGYKDYIINLPSIKEKKIEITLIPVSFDLYFPEKTTYKIGDAIMKGPIFASNIKNGSYEINIAKDGISFKKSSPFLPAEASIGTAFGLSLAFMITTIACSSYYSNLTYSASNDFDRKLYDNTRHGFDIGMYVSIATTSIFGLSLASLFIADGSTRAYNKKQKIEIENKTPTDKGKSFYDTAVYFLGIGEIEKSSSILQSLISLYPDSDYLPQVYYQLGQNYFILQDFDNALKSWQIFITDYPLAEYYDYVLKNIAEIYYTKKDYKKAINMLSKVVFTENILNRETIFSFKAKIDLEIYLIEKTNEYFKFAESDYLSLIDGTSNSENLDFYYSQLIKLYKSIGDSDKIVILKKKAEKIQDSSIKQLILSKF